jgi:L-asparaginase
MDVTHWKKLVEIISDNYEQFDGFVILHGTDTMSYTASALSFMLENLGKPVIMTGSQLPIGMLRTDGKENLITAIEIAAAAELDGSPVVSEVCILFENSLLRGNRTTKISAENFNAFRSYNFPILAHAGIHIRYEKQLFLRPKNDLPMRPHYLMNPYVVIFTLFPGMQEDIVSGILNAKSLKAVVFKTFGSGNAPQKEWLIKRIKEAVAKGIIVVNITQCLIGSVEMGKYKTGRQLLSTGVISGYDITPESALTKLMFLLGHGYSNDKIRELMNTDIAGEITLFNKALCSSFPTSSFL